MEIQRYDIMEVCDEDGGGKGCRMMAVCGRYDGETKML
jgi:hypothetical protein